MNKFDKILELLQIKNRSQKDEDELKLLLHNDKDAEDFYNNYNLINNFYNEQSHLTHEELADYILIKNGLDPENKNIIKITPKIEKHLRECATCEKEFKALNSEYSDIENFISSEIVNDTNRLQKDRKSNKITIYTLSSILALILIYISLVFVSGLSTPAYYNYAALEENEDFYVTRGRASENFQNGINALEDKNYENAIKFFQKDIEENSNEETIFYSYYILGLTYLETAEETFIGLFPSFSQSEAEKAISNFLISIKENDSGKFQNISLDAYFYIAKANLMLNNIEAAKKYLNLVIEEKGSKLNDAKIILSELN